METLTQLVPGAAVAVLAVTAIDGPDAGRASTSDGVSLSVGTADGNELVLTDPAVSRFHVELSRAPGGVRVHDQGSTNGTWLGSARLSDAVLPPGALLTIGSTTLQIGEATTVAAPEVLAGGEVAGVVGRSEVMRRAMAQLVRLAGGDASVLIQGESGTGKELAARALHELGPRRGGPFVTVDCGALSPTLVASELFGHERGAFTGADAPRAGALEEAHGGTLFLDEIGELPESLQPVLLGVLERRRFRRLGGRKDLVVDLRLVSATHRDLRGEINARRFRLDLYYRMAVVTVRLPPLRERPEDVAPLVEHFLRECGWDGPTLFSADALRTLERHWFPGNVRELRNFVEAAIALGAPPALSAAHPVEAAAHSTGGLPIRHDLPYKDARAAVVADFERAYLARLLADAAGNASAAARRACLTRSHLLDLLGRHGLRRP